MRISVEVNKDTLREAMAMTGESGKGRALAKAIDEFIRRRKAAQFGRLIREGSFDYPDYSAAERDSLNPVPPLSKS